jgi:hypothetical protein
MFISENTGELSENTLGDTPGDTLGVKSITSFAILFLLNL